MPHRRDAVDAPHVGASRECTEAVSRRRRPRAGIIDRSFGFMTAVSEATRAIEAARTEAESNRPNGIGVVKLMVLTQSMKGAST